MTFSIVTPSFNQLDWLRLCVASVKDQTADEASVESRSSRADLQETSATSPRLSTLDSRPPHVEHIIQDAGTPGIEEFAREVGADFYRDGMLVFDARRESNVESPESGGDLNDERRETSAAASPLASRPSPPQSSPSTLDPQPSLPQSSPRPSTLGSRPYRIAVYCQSDSGMYDAINRGLLKANGGICAYLNCDEQYLPGTLSRARRFFEEAGETDVLFGAAIVVRPDGSYLCDRKVSVPTRLHTLVSGNLSIFTSSTFFRKASVVDRRLLFDPSWRIVADAVWVIRLLEEGLRMQSMAIPMSSFVFTGDNLSFQEAAVAERHRLYKMAPVYARIGKEIILAAYRMKRLLSGNYSLSPHSYRIFTQQSPAMRAGFRVENPTFRWQTSDRHLHKKNRLVR